MPAAAAVMLCIAASGCFTGIESTPAITDSDVKRQNIRVTAEDKYLDNVVQEIAGHALAPGKRWYVTDGKIRLIMEPSPQANSIAAGDTLTLSAIGEALTVDGQHVAELTLSRQSGEKVVYRTTTTVKTIENAGKAEIPFTVDLDLVEAVRRRMLNQTYYITTSTRYDMNEQVMRGRRFVPVTIDAVEPGNAYYPVRLRLTDDKGQQFQLFMTVDASDRMPRKFASMFSLTNPRGKYPAITDANWQLIVEGKVTQGMTRDECRMALGAPGNIDRQTGYSILREIWTYEDGRFLIFDDGILQSFRQ